MNLALFYVWEDARVWAYWNHSFDVHLSCLEPTPVCLPGKSHGWKSLVVYSSRGRKESDTTEWFHFHFQLSGAAVLFFSIMNPFWVHSPGGCKGLMGWCPQDPLLTDTAGASFIHVGHSAEDSFNKRETERKSKLLPDPLPADGAMKTEGLRVGWFSVASSQSWKKRESRWSWTSP